MVSPNDSISIPMLEVIGAAAAVPCSPTAAGLNGLAELFLLLRFAVRATRRSEDHSLGTKADSLLYAGNSLVTARGTGNQTPAAQRLTIRQRTRILNR
jgi:hypothetical protein